MPYPTGMLSLVLEDIDRRMVAVKSAATRRRDEMAAGNVGSTTILDDLYVRLKQERAALSAAAATPGIADYARAQKADDTLDVVAEFNAVIAALDNVTAWIETNFPKDVNGYLLARTLGANGPVDRQFSSAQTATLRAQLDSLIATID